MTVASHSANRYLDRPAPSSLADVIDTILDKGLVIDIYVRVSLVGIELLTIDARIVIASVDTYLRFAEAVGRLDLTQNGSKGLPEMVEDIDIRPNPVPLTACAETAESPAAPALAGFREPVGADHPRGRCSCNGQTGRGGSVRGA